MCNVYIMFYDMQTEQLLCWSGNHREHTTSGSNEEDPLRLG